jgi:hypothetical protein
MDGGHTRLAVGQTGERGRPGGPQRQPGLDKESSGQLTGSDSLRPGPDMKALERRQGRIERRIADLQSRRRTGEIKGAEERLAVASQHAREAQASAQQAIGACRDAYLRAAHAHDRAAAAHQRAANAGSGDRATHRRMIEFHRAAAEADRQQAEQITETLGEAAGLRPARGKLPVPPVGPAYFCRAASASMFSYSSGTP